MQNLKKEPYYFFQFSVIRYLGPWTSHSFLLLTLMLRYTF